MRALITGLSLLSATIVMATAMASPAAAISRYNALSMSCEQARQILRREGAAILRYPSKNVAGLTRYDRYVRNSRQCDAHEYANWTRIPTRDNASCPVLACEPIPDREDRRFRLFMVPNYSL